MKKLISLMFTAFLFLAVACGSGPESVAKKIDKKEKLDQKDYTEMIQYMVEAVDEMYATVDKYKDQPDKLKGEIEDLEKKYPYLEKFGSNLPPDSELDQTNKQKLHELTVKMFNMSASSPVL